MKTLPSNSTLRFIDSKEGVPVFMDVIGLKVNAHSKLSLKTNEDQLAIISDGVVACHMTGIDNDDLSRIGLAKGVAFDAERGCVRIDCQPKGKNAKVEVIPGVGQTVEGIPGFGQKAD